MFGAALLCLVLFLAGSATMAGSLKIRYSAPDNDVYVWYFDYGIGAGAWIMFPPDDKVSIEFIEQRWIGLYSYDVSQGYWRESLYLYGTTGGL
jgi:hypothetical protein